MGKYSTSGLQAQGLYLKGKTLEQISELTGVSVTTLSAWKNTYNWDEKRDSYRKRPGAIQEKIVDILQHKLEDVDPANFNSVDADIVSKMTKAAKDLGDTEDIGAEVLVGVDNFGAYVNGSDLSEEKKGIIFDAIKGFLNDVGKNVYGK